MSINTKPVAPAEPDARIAWMRSSLQNVLDALNEIDDKAGTMSVATRNFFLQTVTSEANAIVEMSRDVRKGR